MYTVIFTQEFNKRAKKLVKKNNKLKQKIEKAITNLQSDPHFPSLKTHKIGKIWSSWVTSDLRVLWRYDENNKLTILLLKIGGHDGTNGVY
jgi:mRNA-degrading endonuclease YafQ of YafQ-DinJ toxin-antitoxin module